MLINNLPKLYDDELLYSYLYRIALSNGIPDIKFFFREILLPEDKQDYEYRFVRYDIHDDLYRITDKCGIDDITAVELYRTTSIYPGVCPFMTKATSSHHTGTLSAYRCKSNIITPMSDLFTELRYCPECMMEEKYYRRMHQMPSVTACALHGCKLHTYKGRHGCEFKDLNKSIVTASDNEIAYALFCRDLLNADINCDLKTVLQLLRSEVSEDEKIRKITSRNSNYIKSDEIINAVMMVFGNVGAFKEKTTVNTDLKKSFDCCIKNNYELCSEYRESIVELRCNKCGSLFITSPYRIVSGWGCPDCDAKIPDTVLFDRLFNVSCKGCYRLLSEYNGVDVPVEVEHIACGKRYEIKPRKIIEENVRCMCGLYLSADEIKSRVEESGLYTLMSANDEKIRVYHKSCGRDFTCSYKSFLRHPTCRECHRDKRKNEDINKRIFDLVGDEYRLTALHGKYADMIHTGCNKVNTYYLHSFLNGRRCPYCHKRMTYKELCRTVSEKTHGEYECIERINNDSVMIRNILTGKEVKMQKIFVLQELNRPCGSQYFQLTKGEMTVG